MTFFVDRTAHPPIGRPVRKRTTAVVLHRTIELDADGDGDRDADDVIAFFTRDPEGVATVALPGSYQSKLQTISAWRQSGIPSGVVGFVPYHYLVQSNGIVVETLPPDAKGAHAGAFNDRSIGVALIGDFRKVPPTEEAITRTVELLRHLRNSYGDLEILDHDQANAATGVPAKGCAGACFPLAEIRVLARR